ncbi:MurR/RpiR family transcriptional regulator [Clostridium uliginosum]|uniref:DNA-binding transcriptional regulator, MurR/RpiR family, contains HTH and SIS domains n=1 Tax=Clostridium uliginosum TaxID=119641 RepID=A0A1I1S1P6_9CLOT|nr:MurR/RpiR family transcriptional regulator [Clostridium uliginosum]SFD40534.1 DNA-binding transcriptional regulator, MurR/RpiR family, contains HTH and SIS domains [Clostridium uliginosum]
MDVLCEIQRIYNSFSDKEKSIADYILQHGDMLKNINITELAKNTGTSGATITRFSKKIGCENFVDMKMKLSSNKVETDIPNEDGIFSYVYQYYNEVIEKTKYLIDKESIFKIVNKIKNAKTIYIYGVGSSGLTGTEMMQRLLRMGFNVHCISDSHMMIINSSIVSEDDLVIGISISGETEEVIQALRISKDNNATVASITSFENSTITKYSDIKFTVYNAKFIDKNRFINSQFSTMYLLDLISMVLLKDSRLSNNMQITINAIINS